MKNKNLITSIIITETGDPTLVHIDWCIINFLWINFDAMCYFIRCAIIVKTTGYILYDITSFN